MRLRLLATVWACLTFGVLWTGSSPRGWAALPAPPAPTATSTVPLTPEEEAKEEKEDAEIGKKAAAEVEKEVKVLDTYSTTTLQQIVDRIRPFTEKPHQKYTVKVVDEKNINAFSLPGGYLYFTKGLVQAAESEDELAAVAGHEMGHVCLNHARKAMKRDAKYNKILGPLILAAVLARSQGVDPGAIAAMGSVLKTNTMNQWGQEAEFQADAASVRYLTASKVYNPVAMLTVLEGLAIIEKSGPEQNLGAYQDHPDAEERIEAVRTQLAVLHIPIERPRVRKGIIATANSAVVEGKGGGRNPPR